MKLKFILLIVIFGLLSNGIIAQQKSADEILKEAFKEAKQHNKNVMVIFKASWSSWCKQLIANINNDSCRDLFERNYVVKKLDVLEKSDKKDLENFGALSSKA